MNVHAFAASVRRHSPSTQVASTQDPFNRPVQQIDAMRRRSVQNKALRVKAAGIATVRTKKRLIFASIETRQCV
jgi:hypothetical protein